MRSILVDAGPLIALRDRSDRHHRRVAQFLEAYEGALLTTWPVLATPFELSDAALSTIADWKEKYRD